jgi:hypothetical protein
VPLAVRMLGERWRGQQKRCQATRYYSAAQHTLIPCTSLNLVRAASRIRGYVILHLKIVEHIEIGI